MATQYRLLVCFCILTSLYPVGCCRINTRIRHPPSQIFTSRQQCHSSERGLKLYKNDHSESSTRDTTPPGHRIRDITTPSHSTRDTTTHGDQFSQHSSSLTRDKTEVKHGDISNVPFQFPSNVLHIFVERIVFPLLHLAAWLIVFWVFKSTNGAGSRVGSMPNVEKYWTSSIGPVSCPKKSPYSSTELLCKKLAIIHTTNDLNNNAKSYDLDTEDSQPSHAATTVVDEVSSFVNEPKQPDDLGEVNALPENKIDHTGDTHGNIPGHINPVIDSDERQASSSHSVTTKHLDKLPEALGIFSEKHLQYPQTLENSYFGRGENAETEFHTMPADVQIIKGGMHCSTQLHFSDVPSGYDLEPNDTYLSDTDTVHIHTNKDYIYTEDIVSEPNVNAGVNFQVLDNDNLKQEVYENNFLKSTRNIPTADSGESGMAQYHTLCQRLLETSSFLESETTDDRFSLLNTSLNTVADRQILSSLECPQSVDDTDDMLQECPAHKASNQFYDPSMECDSYIKTCYAGIADEREEPSQRCELKQCSFQLPQKTHRDRSRLFDYKGRPINVRDPELITQNIKKVDGLYHKNDPQLLTGSHSDKAELVQSAHALDQTPNRLDCFHPTVLHAAHMEARTVLHVAQTGAQQMKDIRFLENLSDPERQLEKVPLLYQLLVASVETDQRELMSEMIKPEKDDANNSETCAELVKGDYSSSQVSFSNIAGKELERSDETVCDPFEEADTQGTSSRTSRAKGVTKIPEIPLDLDFVYMSCDTGKLVPVKDFIKIVETCYLGVEEKKDIVYKQYIIAREKCCLDWIEAIRNRGKKILPKWWLHRNLRVEGLESNKCRKRREWLERKQAQALEEQMLREKKDLIFLGTKPDISTYLDLPVGPDSLLFHYSEDGCPMFQAEQYFDAVLHSGVKDRLTNLQHSELNEGLPSRWQPAQLPANQDFPSEIHVTNEPRAEQTWDEPCSNFPATYKSELAVEDGRGDAFYE